MWKYKVGEGTDYLAQPPLCGETTAWHIRCNKGGDGDLNPEPLIHGFPFLGLHQSQVFKASISDVPFSKLQYFCRPLAEAVSRLVPVPPIALSSSRGHHSQWACAAGRRSLGGRAGTWSELATMKSGLAWSLYGQHSLSGQLGKEK